MSAAAQQHTIEVKEQELPLHCPTPATPVWNMHPRVFLDVAKTGDARCPYCGAHYIYRGPPPAGH